MDNLHLMFWDSDELFLERLATYIHQSAYQRRIRLQTICGSDKQSYVISPQHPSSVLVCAEPYFISKLSQYFSKVILLSEGGESSQTDNYSVIHKYQPLPQLLDQILSIYDRLAPISPDESAADLMPISTSVDKKVISLYSLDGGSGKTTAAYFLARHFSHMKKKVFYLNLESYPSINCLLTAQNQMNLSEILYYLKNERMQSGMLAPQIEHNDSDSFSCFQTAYHLNDLQEMSHADTVDIITFLLHRLNYDVIITDLDHSLHPRTISALEHSDVIWWLLTPDWKSRYRIEMYLNQCIDICGLNETDWTDKLFLIMNKYTGCHGNQSMSINGHSVAGYLPYIPEWKEPMDMTTIISNKEYAFHMAQLVERWVGEYGRDTTGALGFKTSR